MEQDAIRRNLLDAGCRDELAGQVCDLLASGRQKEALKFIAQYRKRLLDCCHAEQKKSNA